MRQFSSSVLWERMFLWFAISHFGHTHPSPRSPEGQWRGGSHSPFPWHGYKWWLLEIQGLTASHPWRPRAVRVCCCGVHGLIHTPGMNDHSSIPQCPQIRLKCSLELLLCGPPLPEGAKQVNTKGTERIARERTSGTHSLPRDRGGDHSASSCDRHRGTDGAVL